MWVSGRCKGACCAIRGCRATYACAHPALLPFFAYLVVAGRVTAADQEVEGGLPASWEGGLGLLSASPAGGEDEADRAEQGGGRQASGHLGDSTTAGAVGAPPPQPPPQPAASEDGLAASPASPAKAGAAVDGPSPAADGSGSSGPALAVPPCPAGAAAVAAAADTSAEEGGGSGSDASPTWKTVRLIWAPMAALSLSSTVALTLFPFFTYVPTSGLLGESLPKVRQRAARSLHMELHVTPKLPLPLLPALLQRVCGCSGACTGHTAALPVLPWSQVIFFVRIFADVLGRFLPRLSFLTAHSPATPLIVSGVKALGELGGGEAACAVAFCG